MKKCQNILCGANNPNDAIYCHMCGDKLPVRKRHYGWILAVMVSILLSGGLICYFNSSGRDPEYDFKISKLYNIAKALNIDIKELFDF